MKTRFHAFTLAGIFAIGLTLALSASSNYARHAFAWSQNPCYAPLLERAHGSAELVILGSSRLLVGLDPRTVAPGFGIGQDQAFNLAHNDRSYLVDRLLLDEVSAQRAPRIAIVEAYTPSDTLYALERQPNHQQGASDVAMASGSIDRMAVALARYSDLAPSDPQSALLRLHERVSLAARKIDQFAGLVLSGRLALSYALAERRLPRTPENVCRPIAKSRGKGKDVGIRERYVAAFKPDHPGNWLSWSRDRPEFLGSGRHSQERQNMAAMVRLAQSRGIKILFLYLPSKFIPPPEEAFTADFEKEIGAPLWVPPPDLLLQLQYDGFEDEGHLRSQGRRAVSSWLAAKAKTSHVNW